MSDDADMTASPAGTRELPDRDAAQRLVAPRYEVADTVGHGASATVFEVRDRRADGARLAVKLTDLERAPDPDAFREGLRREFLLAVRFSHPNLVRHFEFDLPPGGSTAVTTMEFVEGVPFSPALLGREPGLTCRLVIGLLRGLQFLHECDFVHADVKPSNVLCRIEDGSVRAKLLDYHLTYNPRIAQRNEPRGTLRYMAPEAIAGEGVDGRADLYSVGVLMFEALTGRTLFEGSVGDIVTQHLAAAVGGLEETGELAGVVARLLAKRPAGRYVSAAEAIEAVAEAAGVDEPPETAETLLARVHSAPCIGRNAILEEARGALLRVEAGEPGPLVWLLEGPPGSGRSRLLAELRALAQARGWCAVDSRPGSEGKALRPSGRRLLLTLDDASPGPAALGTIREALATAAPGCEAVVCIADAGGDAARWAGAGPLRVLDMADLSPAERREAACRMLPAAVDARLVEHLAGGCGGLPATAAATIEHLLAGGRILPGPGGRLTAAGPLFDTAPEPLRRTWQSALAAVPAPVRTIVQVLAAAGSGLPASLCAIAADMAEGDVGALLCGADARVLVEACDLEEGPGWRLRHNAIATLFADAEGGPADSGAHTRLADAVAAWDGGRERIWQARRARHLLLGGATETGVREALQVAEALDRWDVRPDYLEMLRLAVGAAQGPERLVLAEAVADCAAARGDSADALHELNAALEEEGLAAGDRLRLERKAAAALVDLGRCEDASGLLDRCIQAQSGPEADGGERARIQLQVARCELAASRTDRAEAMLGEVARAAKQAGDDATLGAAWADLGIVSRTRHDAAEAHEHLAKAEAVLRGAGDRVGTVRALGLRGYLLMAERRLEASERDLRESLRLLREAGCTAQLARALMGLGSVMQLTGRWESAITQYEEALRLADSAGSSGTKMAVLVNLSHVRAAVGWLEKALEDAEGALELAASARARSAALNRLGRVQYALGLFERARASFLANVRMAEEAASPGLLETGERMAAAVAIIAGDLDEACTRLRHALQICQDRLGATREAMCRVRLVELALARGDTDGALRESQKAWDVAESQAEEHARVRAWLGRGKALLAAGRPDAAIEDLHRADKVLRKTGVWDDQVETQYELGRSYASAGRRRFAALYLGNALGTVEQVAGRLRQQENYKAFLSAPLPAGIFRAIQELRETADVRQATGI